MSQQIIRAYFETKLSTWAATQSPALKIAYQNVPFTPPTTENYLETWLIPADTFNPTVDATKVREVGLFQVNVVGLEGKGTKALYDIAQAIVNLFPVVPKDGVVSVESTPHIMQPINNSVGRPVLPVRITYRMDS